MNIKHEIQPNLPQLLFVVNDITYFLLHWLPIARAAKVAGFVVHVAAPDGEKAVLLRDEGFIYHVWPMARGSKNPFAELVSFCKLARILRQVKADITHFVAMKPILYGGIAARWMGARAVVATVTGLGFVFSSGGIQARVLRFFVAIFYRVALRHPNLRVVFQNDDDAKIIARIARLKPENTALIRGAGVNLTKFMPLRVPAVPPVVVLVARLLKSKGVPEFIAAARQLLAQGVLARFALVGLPDAENPESVSEADIAAAIAENVVEHWGYREDMPEVFAQSSLVVLPSWREGMSTVLLEAAAAGRAVVTTDVPGCRDAVIPGVTGLLVPPRDANALASAIAQLLNDRERLRAMGQAGRELAEREFDVRGVADKHIDIYRELLAEGKGA